MRARAIKDLMQLADREFFEATAEGLQLIVKNVARLWDAAAALDENHKSAAHVLTMIAEEEAVKALILIDAIRCPRSPASRLSRHLSRFNDHLAKGLYAKACGMRPTTLAELQEYLNIDRTKFYLDGPNDVDWIFRNEVFEQRESSLYVDYVARDDDHSWSDPVEHGHLSYSESITPDAVETTLCLNKVGFFTADALAAIADLWRCKEIGADTGANEIRRLNYSTLEALESRGLLQQQPSQTYSWVFEEWQFPMYDLDLSAVDVNPEVLRERQRNWCPEGY